MWNFLPECINQQNVIKEWEITKFGLSLFMSLISDIRGELTWAEMREFSSQQSVQCPHLYVCWAVLPVLVIRLLLFFSCLLLVLGELSGIFLLSTQAKASLGQFLRSRSCWSSRAGFWGWMHCQILLHRALLVGWVPSCLLAHCCHTSDLLQFNLVCLVDSG